MLALIADDDVAQLTTKNAANHRLRTRTSNLVDDNNDNNDSNDNKFTTTSQQVHDDDNKVAMRYADLFQALLFLKVDTIQQITKQLLRVLSPPTIRVKAASAEWTHSNGMR